jgi:hypothetical protein
MLQQLGGQSSCCGRPSHVPVVCNIAGRSLSNMSLCLLRHLPLLSQALTAASASASEHSGRAEVEHARLSELEALLEAKHRELEEAQVCRCLSLLWICLHPLCLNMPFARCCLSNTQSSECRLPASLHVQSFTGQDRGCPLTHVHFGQIIPSSRCCYDTLRSI